MKFKAKIDVVELKKFLNSFDDDTIEIELESRFIKNNADLYSELSYDEVKNFFAEKINIIKEYIKE